MAKQSGLGDLLLVHGYNFSGDVQKIDRIGGGPDELMFTGIDKSAKERLGGQLDGGFDVTTYFNDATGQAHDILSALPTTDVHLGYCRGQTLGNAGAACVSKQIGYDGERGDDGSLLFKVEAKPNGYGVEWGVQGTAGVRSDTAATNGSSIDNGASTAHGLQAYLHVLSFTGTSCTVKLQESSDDGGADTWADVTGGSFGAQSAVGASRIATAAGLTVERYLRVVTTGTFSQCSFTVLIVRNETVSAL